VRLNIVSTKFIRGRAETGGALFVIIFVTNVPNQMMGMTLTDCEFQGNQAFQRENDGHGAHLYLEFEVDKLSQDVPTTAFIEIDRSNFVQGIADAGSGGITIVPNIQTNISVTITDSYFKQCFGFRAHFLDMSFT
jgi:hypothetical protein